MGEDVRGFRMGAARGGGELGARAASASIAGATRKICVRICYSTTELTPNISASRSASSQKNMYEVPDHVSYQDAALVEPLACVMRGLEETGVRPGDTVAVIGLGPIGMMFVRLAKAVYNARVIAIGRRPAAIGPGRDMGADEDRAQQRWRGRRWVRCAK